MVCRRSWWRPALDIKLMSARKAFRMGLRLEKVFGQQQTVNRRYPTFSFEGAISQSLTQWDRRRSLVRVFVDALQRNALIPN